MGLFDRFFNDKNYNKSNSTGEKIRRIRTQKKISASELGEAAGVNHAAVRNYETGYRQVSSEKLSAIADKLGVPTETLLDRQINGYLDAIHILFELSEQYEFVPVTLPQEPRYAIQTKDAVILQALQAWSEKRRQWEKGSITQFELREWMDAFPLQCEEGDVTEDGESSYTDYERILGFKSTLESVKLIMDSKYEEITECLNKKDIRTANMHLETMKSTISTLVQVDIKKYGK